MPCTTILAGKCATYDGSTFISRNDDSCSGKYVPTRWTVVQPGEQPKEYKSVISHVTIKLPKNPMRYTAVPHAILDEGIWAASGVNDENIAMTATETITTNERVLGADPLVTYVPGDAESTVNTKGGVDVTVGKPGGIGEEDIVVLVLPYIHSAREGVMRLGGLLEKYGTYESNGIAFSDKDEVWWLESIGGHHWIAKKVPDDSYVIMPNQLGIDSFDLDDALGKKGTVSKMSTSRNGTEPAGSKKAGSAKSAAQKTCMCSADLREFIDDNHLNLSFGDTGAASVINPREVFGSHDEADHVYNTPRAWFMGRYLSHDSMKWDGPDADYTPVSDDIPWCAVPDRKITVEDVKYLLSSHFQGTPYDPYASYGDPSMRGAYRSIGVNRNSFLALIQIRPYVSSDHNVIMWLASGSNTFNAFTPFYANVDKTPEYLSNTTAQVTTDNLYWSNRLIGALADAHYGKCLIHIERYQSAVMAKGHELIAKYDREFETAVRSASAVKNAAISKAIKAKNAGTERNADADKTACALCEKADLEIADMLKKETSAVLGHVLGEASDGMKNAYARSDN